MHILLIHQYFWLPGSWGNNRSYAFARAWAEAGHEVTVLTSTAFFPEDHRAHQRHFTRFRHEGLQILAHRVPYGQKMSAFRRLLAFLQFFLLALWSGWRLQRPDVIYACSSPPSVGQAGQLLSRWHRVPFVFETIDVWPDIPIGMGLIEEWPLGRLINLTVNRIYDRARAIIALSDGMRELIIGHGKRFADKTHVIPNGTDPMLFHPPEAAKPAGEKTVRLVYAGAFGPANDLRGLLEALAEVKDMPHLPPWECVLIGDGSERTLLKTAIRNHELQQHVHIWPPQPKAQLAETLQAMDIGVVCFAQKEVLETNSANKYFDYLATGLPVVLNYQGWQAKHLRTYGCGLSSPQGDTQAFSRNLAGLIADSSQRLRLGSRGRQLALQYYDRHVLAQQALDICDWAARQREHPPQIPDPLAKA